MCVSVCVCVSVSMCVSVCVCVSLCTLDVVAEKKVQLAIDSSLQRCITLIRKGKGDISQSSVMKTSDFFTEAYLYRQRTKKQKQQKQSTCSPQSTQSSVFAFMVKSRMCLLLYIECAFLAKQASCKCLIAEMIGIATARHMF